MSQYVVIVYNVIGGEVSTSVRKAVLMKDEENARMLGDGFHLAARLRAEADGHELIGLASKVVILSEP